MGSKSLLRKQVKAELKKRRYVFYTLVFLSLFYLAAGLIFGDTGFVRYTELSEKKTKLEKDVEDLKRENEQLGALLESYKKNDFLSEKHAREDFGMSKPDEYIFLYEK